MKKAQLTRDTGINQDKEMIWIKRVKNKLQPCGQDIPIVFVPPAKVCVLDKFWNIYCNIK